MQMESRNLTADYMEDAHRAVARFHEYTNDYPWNWSAGDLEAWSSELLGGRQASTVRQLQGHVGRFLGYLLDPAYEWVDVCEHYFGTHPVQVCSEWNTIRQHEAGDVPGPRPFTRSELVDFFDYCDTRVDRARRARRKGALASARDAAMFKAQYAWGLRRRENCRLDLRDVAENPRQAEFGRAGVLDVRWGKGSAGKGPKRRPVLTVMVWSAGALTQYIDIVRPCYESGPALWVSERRVRVSEASYNERFSEYREALKFPAELTPHAFRRSYITHLLEDGWDLRFVQKQVGHVHATTTTLYWRVSDDFMTTTLNDALMDGAPEDVWMAGLAQ